MYTTFQLLLGQRCSYTKLHELACHLHQLMFIKVKFAQKLLLHYLLIKTIASQYEEWNKMEQWME